MLQRLRVHGYRSLRDVELGLAGCTLVVGANGSGKTNLYRAMQLVVEAADGRLGRSIAEEAGMQSLLWAGERRKDERNRVSVELAWADLTYALELALPNPHGFGFATRFTRDPVVASEAIRAPDRKRTVTLLERGHASCTVRNAEGARVTYPVTLVESESVLSQIAEPHLYPELSGLRARLAGLRFYHHFRTDAEAPMRDPRVGTRTLVLGNDGSDLAAAVETIEEIGEGDVLRGHVARAFDGATLAVETSEDGRFIVTMKMPGMRRPLTARELSDGTLRYLCLLVALLSPRPAPLLVLNEPETSLHPDLLTALVDPIAEAARRSQLLILTHAHAFADAVMGRTAAARVELERIAGATTVRQPEDS